MGRNGTHALVRAVVISILIPRRLSLSKDSDDTVLHNNWLGYGGAGLRELRVEVLPELLLRSPDTSRVQWIQWLQLVAGRLWGC
jgi:hypothetical protein